MSNNPSYLVYVCPVCVAIRHLKPKNDGSNVYYCSVCKLEFLYDNGIITKIGIPPKSSSHPSERYSNPKSRGIIRNPYGRMGRPNGRMGRPK